MKTKLMCVIAAGLILGVGLMCVCGAGGGVSGSETPYSARAEGQSLSAESRRAGVYAAEGDSGDITITRDTLIDEELIPDTNLFKALTAIIAAKEFEQTGNNIIPVDFKAGYFSDFTVLNLSNDVSNKIGNTDINTNPNKKITNLSGLENLFFDNLQELYLNNNEIEVINNDVFNKAPNLYKLEIKNNGLKQFDVTIGKLFDAVKLNTLDLSYNKLTEIDLSQLEYYTSGPNRLADANLSFNELSDKTKITVPQSSYVSLNLDLTANNLFDVTSSDFSGHNALLYIQGYKQDKVFAEGDKIRVYASGVSVKAVFNGDSDFYIDGESNIASESNEGLLIVPAGKISIIFEKAGTDFTDTEFESKKFEVRPIKVEFKVFDIDGTQIDILKEYAKPINIVLITVDGRDTFISLNNGQTYEGASGYELREHGSYNFRFVMVYDGLYSDPTYYSVKIINLDNMVWGLVIVIGLAVLVVTMIFVIRWYKNGGVVAPLSDKERNRMSGGGEQR